MRNIPSPEQGASTSTRSKKPGNLAARRSVFSLVTMALATPMRSMFRARIFARAGLYSLQSSSPCPSILPAIWVDFPPGAAQRSQIRSPGRGSSRATADIALASCK